MKKHLYFLFAILSAHLGFAQTSLFTYTGSIQTYTVPAGISSLHIDASGGCGGNNSYDVSSPSSNHGGRGGRVMADMSVTAGQVLYIYVGGNGDSIHYIYGNISGGNGLGGWNGGGNGSGIADAGGGGASDIRIGGTALANRVLVAGGGGGAGGDDGNFTDYTVGGNGGGLTGETGHASGASSSLYGGSGGDQSSGGVEGSVIGGPYSGVVDGSVGVGGVAFPVGFSSGGGGGGYYGGAGGFLAGGGGGSSYTNATLVTSVTHTQGYNGGGAAVLISGNCSGGDISGSASLCVHSVTTLVDTVGGSSGHWSSLNTSVATIGSSTGIVTAVSSGVAWIKYTVTSFCGAANSYAAVTVNPTASVITGTTSLCVGATTYLGDTLTTGGWYSSDPSVAAPSVYPLLGISAGTATITYMPGTGSNCYATTTATVYPAPGSISGITSSICVGSAVTLSNTLLGGAWSSSNSAIATVGSGGLILGVSAGTVTISYNMATGCYTTTVVNIGSLSAITGANKVCPAQTITLSNVTSGGAWSSSNTAVAIIGPGIVSGLSAGTTTVSYVVGSGCYATTVINVGAPPATTGSGTVCLSQTMTLNNASPGGTWSSSNTAKATISSGGVVLGIASGTSIISYNMGAGCFATNVVTVSSMPAITGASALCPLLSTRLNDAASNGVWSSSNTSVATIVWPGTVTAVAAGTTIMSYTISDGCVAVQTMTVNPLPGAIIDINNVVCNSSPITFSDATSGGTWSSSDPHIATIGSTGVVSGVTNGIATISYTITSTGCYTTTVVNVGSLPAITGASTFCALLSTTLNDASAGGAWSSSNTSVATVAPSSGIVTGIAGGTTIITYSTDTGLGCATFALVTISQAPGAFTGANVICSGAATTLSNATAGGTWSSSASSIATVGTTGLMTGVSQGTLTISYTLSSTGCSNWMSVTVNPTPVISGITALCKSSTVTLSSSVAGGAWSSSNTAIVAIGSSSGVVTSGVTTGTSTITYILPTGCMATQKVTVVLTPGAISGTKTLCTALTVSLSDAGTGIWSSNDATIASVNAGTGQVTGVASGTTVITYFLGTGCTTNTTVTVNQSPAAITGTFAICNTFNTTLSDAISGGKWTSSNTAIAIGSSTGIVTGVTVGNAKITYTLTDGCIATNTFTINPNPSAITGALSVCSGGIVTLSNTVAGGVWASGNTSVATVGSASRVVTGVSAGTANITYTLPAGCTAVGTETVNPTPPLASPGLGGACKGLSVTFSDALSGGAWTVNNTSIATIDISTGVMTGVTVGSSILSYTMPTGCSYSKTIFILSVPGAIAGSTAICTAGTTTLSEPTTGGAWSNSNSSVATFNSLTEVVTGITAGTTVISYTISNGCPAIKTITVNPTPSAISGTAGVCTGLTTTLSDGGGGIWNSSNTSVAVVDASTGVLTGIVAGTATITYGFSASCQATKVVTVSTTPAAIAGTSTICAGDLVTLSTASTGGTWSSSNSSTATIGSATGVVTGLSAGTSAITYLLGTGCSSSATVTVNPLPGPISGSTGLCSGLTATLSDSGGGAWSSSNTSVATVGAGTGIVTAVAPGTSAITYAFTTGCTATTAVTIFAAPSAITGTSGICAGATTALSNANTGGVWSSGNTSAATINTVSGVVTGISAGTSVISYSIGSGCTVTQVVTVNPMPSAITGTTGMCSGASVTLSDVGGGTWSGGNTTVATINSSTGTVTGIAGGTASVTYTLATGCATSATITVVASPAAITGVPNECTGATTTLSEASAGGTWSSSNTAVATISTTTRIMTGISPGTATITYTVGTGCIAGLVVTINPVPSAIAGTASTCTGATTTLSDGGGGIWSSGNTAIATINASTGTVTGIAAGTASITYAFGPGCRATKAVTIHTSPSAITGVASICTGATATLSDATTTGTWTSDNTAVATILSLSRVVTGVSAGTANITYMVSTGCSSAKTITVNPIPAAITGATGVCKAASITLGDTGGGMWSSSSTTIATIDASTGVTTGVAAGNAAIAYTLSTGCKVTKTVTVLAAPAAITGASVVCAGAATTLSDATTMGTWTSDNTSVATIVSLSRVVTGVSAGAANITYTLSSGCSSAKTITVNPLPAAITGAANLCKGDAITLSDGGGGVWNSSSTTIATVDSFTGIVTGIAAGTAKITYTLITGCKAIQTETVHAVPAAIAGASAVCSGATATLSDATTSGTWTSDNTSVATIVSLSRVVTGIAAGTANITYMLTSGCSAAKTITINALPDAIAGTPNICKGASATLSDAGGGSWSSANTAIVTVGASTGIITGIGAGTTSITYTLGTTCRATRVATVHVVPVAIAGKDSVCAGATITLSDATTGGLWSSSNTSVATIGSTSRITLGVVAGTVTITYALSTGCGAYTTVTVNSCGAAPAFLNDSSATGINTVSFTPTLQVYPNPNEGAFNLQLVSDVNKQAVMTITNIVGQKILELPIETNKIVPVTINQSAGIYVITIITANERYVTKVTVNR